MGGAGRRLYTGYKLDRDSVELHRARFVKLRR